MSRVVHSVAFTEKQWAKIEELAEGYQIPVGTLVRNAALHALGIETEVASWQRLASAMEKAVGSGSGSGGKRGG